MSFAGVSVIAKGRRLGIDTSTATASVSGYHLLAVQDHSRMRQPLLSHVSYYRNEDGYILLCVFLNEENDTTADPVKAHVVFSFVDETYEQELAHIHGRKILELRGQHTHAIKYIKRAVLDKHLKNDSLTIRCDVVVLNPTCDTAFIKVPLSDMQQNFTEFLLAGEGTDVVFQVGGETFAAHRRVLAARSMVFRAALFGPMKEGTSTDTTVQIEDMDAMVFNAMLGFIYSDSFHALVADENEVDLLQYLLVVTDMYNLTRLQAMCERKLCEHIEVGTATTILVLAEQHGCNGLRKACYKFLQRPDNLRAVVDMDGFDQLCRSCPSLMKDMILGLLPPK
ncbi:BTB/POZ and MATH domain-containing protein 2-like [Triticum urartu]|uniref:BTB/POZ and MATH domain-containing protein 2-like n=1 Tax=Triticum urartu TaxID=4572 RepID=UPI0020441FC8|nr:BTB/POZ and MATH domain-containing protein 2-like [Triticum urartu]